MVTMRPQFQMLALLSWTLFFGIASTELARGPTCEDGWYFHENHCYLIRNEYETFEMAQQTCKLFGAQLAYAEGDGPFVFFANLVSKQKAYAWWYGAQVTYDGEPLVFDRRAGYYSKPLPGMVVTLPDHKKLKLPSTKCVGLIHDHIDRDNDFAMTDVPCHIELPYACRGDPKTVKLPESTHLVKNDTDIYWFSSPDDRRSYDDAKTACIDKGMALLSIRGDLKMQVIINEITKRQDKRIDPWWIGLQVTKGIFSWSDNVPMQDSVVNWNRKRGSYRYYDESCRVILTDGTGDDKSCWSAKAPFICKKDQGLYGRFGCPQNWWRAGQSCYNHASINKQNYATYNDAEKLCAKAGGHPITVDTRIEKTWLMHSVFFEYQSSYGIWTSLNDKKKSGNLVWTNGQHPKDTVLTWSAGETLQGNGQCFVLTPKSGVIRRSYCETNSLPGCQHPAGGSNDCITKNWKKFKGNCYYFNQYPKRVAYPTMLHECYNDIVQKNNDIILSPLKVDSKDVMDFYSKNIAYDWDYVWLGLQEKTKKVYTWSDDTKADISIFSTEYYVGSDNTTSKCATMRRNGEFRLKSCSTCTCGTVLCEKEIGFTVVASASKSENSGNTLSSRVSAKILFMFWAVITLTNYVNK